MLIEFTSRKLIKYLEKHYGYKITEDMAKEILHVTNRELNECFMEEELMDIVDDVMCKYEFGY